MRPSFTATLAALALVLTSLPAAAAAGGSLRKAALDRHAAEHGATLQPARYVSDDDDDDDDVRPLRRHRADDRWERPRRAKPAQARAAKRLRKQARRHAGRQRHVVRRSGRIVARPQPVRSSRAGGNLTGVASFYGGRFHGRRTASGVRYNQHGLSAAHRSLPFGTRVRVTHLGNGRSVDVVINDRGPFIGGRVIDLSHGAAGVIGMHHQGVARVRVSILGRR